MNVIHGSATIALDGDPATIVCGPCVDTLDEEDPLGRVGQGACGSRALGRAAGRPYGGDETRGGAELAAQPSPPVPASTTGGAVAEADRNIATAFLVGFVVRDLALVNHALELADHRQRIGQMLIAMLQMLAELEPPLFAPDAAERWADLAAQLSTGVGEVDLSHVGGPHHEHGARRLPEQAFRGAADEHVVKRAVVVPAHDDRRGVNVVGDPDEGLAHRQLVGHGERIRGHPEGAGDRRTVPGQPLRIGIERLVELRRPAQVQLCGRQLEACARDRGEVVGRSGFPDDDDQACPRGEELRGVAQGAQRGRGAVERDENRTGTHGAGSHE
jgi:hypothetical protein